MWCLWRDRNARSFEGCEWSILQIKSFLFHSLFDWSAVFPSIPFFTLLYVLEHCNPFSFNNIFSLLIQKKKKSYKKQKKPYIVLWLNFSYKTSLGCQLSIHWKIESSFPTMCLFEGLVSALSFTIFLQPQAWFLPWAITNLITNSRVIHTQFLDSWPPQ